MKTRLYKSPSPYFIVLASSVKIKEVEENARSCMLLHKLSHLQPYLLCPDNLYSNNKRNRNTGIPHLKITAKYVAQFKEESVAKYIMGNFDSDLSANPNKADKILISIIEKAKYNHLQLKLAINSLSINIRKVNELLQVYWSPLNSEMTCRKHFVLHFLIRKFTLIWKQVYKHIIQSMNNVQD